MICCCDFCRFPWFSCLDPLISGIASAKVGILLSLFRFCIMSTNSVASIRSMVVLFRRFGAVRGFYLHFFADFD